MTGILTAFRNRTGQFEIVTRLRSVPIHARQKHFARTEPFRPNDPIDCIQPRIHPSAVEIDVVASAPVFLGVDGDHDALPSEFHRRFGNERRVFDCSRIDGDFVRSAREHCPEIVRRAHSAAHGERKEYLFARTEITSQTGDFPR